MPFYLFSGEGSPTKIDKTEKNKVGTLVPTFLQEDLEGAPLKVPKSSAWLRMGPDAGMGGHGMGGHGMDASMGGGMGGMGAGMPLARKELKRQTASAVLT